MDINFSIVQLIDDSQVREIISAINNLQTSEWERAIQILLSVVTFFLGYILSNIQYKKQERNRILTEYKVQSLKLYKRILHTLHIKEKNLTFNIDFLGKHIEKNVFSLNDTNRKAMSESERLLIEDLTAFIYDLRYLKEHEAVDKINSIIEYYDKNLYEIIETKYSYHQANEKLIPIYEEFLTKVSEVKVEVEKSYNRILDELYN